MWSSVQSFRNICEGEDALRTNRLCGKDAGSCRNVMCYCCCGARVCLFSFWIVLCFGRDNKVSIHTCNYAVMASPIMVKIKAASTNCPYWICTFQIISKEYFCNFWDSIMYVIIYKCIFLKNKLKSLERKQNLKQFFAYLSITTFK